LKRLRAGWIVALVYLLCVLAPTLAFALPGSRAVTPCLTEAAHGSGIIVKPSAPTAFCEVEGYRKVTDNAPPRLYRPPIS
jgi:hypothetical protein